MAWRVDEDQTPPVDDARDEEHGTQQEEASATGAVATPDLHLSRRRDGSFG